MKNYYDMHMVQLVFVTIVPTFYLLILKALRCSSNAEALHDPRIIESRLVASPVLDSEKFESKDIGAGVSKSILSDPSKAFIHESWRRRW